ncbi:MAG: FMN-binding protein [Deltaproteobacteria bacterium]|nr:FMN-binding protein [Deltaproteobacteria bacterium]
MTQAQTSENGKMPAPRKGGHLFQAWLVLLLAVIFGACLSAVHVSLSGRISDNKLNESLEKIPELIWGGMEQGAPPDQASIDIAPGRIAVTSGQRTTYYPVFRVNAEGALAGWVLKAAGQGYAGKVELLLGLNPAGDKITGLFVLGQSETPGLGNKISSPEWLAQFAGQRTAAPLKVVKGGEPAPGVIDAITGATISSRSVTGIVNRAIGETRGLLTPEQMKLTERSQ